VLKRWRATPLPPPRCWFAGRIAATVLLATASGAVTVLAGAMFYDTHLDVAAALSLLAALVLGAAAWASIGTAASGLIPAADAAWPLLGATYLPGILLSGIFGLVGEPDCLATLVSYLPARPIVDTAASLNGRDIAVLIARTAAGLVASLRLFRWEPRPPKRHRDAVRRAVALARVPRAPRPR
jgi:ABC-2 type transport system permease protein